ncbi:MAG: hemolysin family protein [Microscillaceae bacterium]|nr:hemolysin family protein [Microscillaceae bacterium]
MIIESIITLFLVFLNGFFVAAEFAIVKVRSSQIQVRANQSFSARIAQNVIKNLDGCLAATQLGITLASLGLGWIGEDVVSKLVLNIFYVFGLSLSEETAHQIALPVAFILITILHIVFGELAPKSIAIRYPTQTTLWVSIPLQAFSFVFSPFIWVLNGFANLLLKLVGIQPVGHGEVHSEEELKLIISESAEGGAIESSERELIQNVFDFDDRVVRQILKTRTHISAIEINTSIEEALEFAIQEGYSRYPIYKDNLDQILGFITTRDLLAASREKTVPQLADVIRPIIFVYANKKIAHLLRMFQIKKVQMAIIINEFGGTEGLVTMEDILEELVGEIQDEYDNEAPIVQKINETTFRILAQNSVEEINSFLPMPLPTSADYVTVAGLILEVTGRIPEKDTLYKVGGYQIKILKLVQSSIQEVELTLINAPLEETAEMHKS